MNPITSSRLPASLKALAAAAEGKKAEEARRSEEARELSGVRQSDPRKDRPRAPQMDAYIPAEPSAPTGLYWVGRDENGDPAIHFDDPMRAAPAQDADDAPRSAGTPSPQDGGPGRLPGNDAAKPDAPAEGNAPAKDTSEDEAPAANSAGKPAKKPEACKGNTDAVDREIKRLKEKKAKLEQQLNAETDEQKRKQLQSQLSQVENELRQKDTDAYRRQHTQVTPV